MIFRYIVFKVSYIIIISLLYFIIKFLEKKIDSMRCDAMRCDAMWFDSIRFDSILCIRFYAFDLIRFDSIRFDSILCIRFDSILCIRCMSKVEDWTNVEKIQEGFWINRSAADTREIFNSVVDENGNIVIKPRDFDVQERRKKPYQILTSIR